MVLNTICGSFIILKIQRTYITIQNSGNMSKEDIISIINEYHETMKNSFYMLMFKELSYFTMFYKNQVDVKYI